MSVAGFDVGSQTSTVAVARKRGIDVLLNKESNRETPSLISFTAKNRQLGTDAFGSLTVNPKNTVSQLKRLIGKRFQDPEVQSDIAKFPFKVSEAPDGGVLVEAQYLGQTATFSPVQLMAMILVDEREIALADGHPVTDCVVTVPVFFNEAERYAMLAASKIAGLTCLRLMNEITATALAYGIYKTDLPEKDPVNVVFVDMGHQALQVSIVAFKKGQLQVLAHAWDRNLGGRNFDEVLFEHFVKEFNAKYKLDVTSNARASFRLRLSCEKLKKVLSANAEATITVESLANDLDVSGKMTREEFEELAKPLAERIRKPLQKALADSGVSLEQISSVELTGGSSRVPMVVTELTEFFGRDPSRTLNAKECVSRGAALQCAMLSPIFRVRDFEVIDKTPYGIEFSWEKDGQPVTSLLFERNTPIPSIKQLTFYRNTKFTIKAQYTADSDLPKGCPRDLGSWEIGPPPVAPPPGENAKIKVKARLNLHGIVSVESATQIVEEEYQEPMKVAKGTGAQAQAAADAAQPADTPMQDGEAAPTSAGDTAMEDAAAPAAAEGAPAESDAAPGPQPEGGAAPMEMEEVMVTKKRTRKVSVPVAAHTLSPSEAEVSGYYEKECELAVQDRLQRETNDKKNDLESYIYSLRNKLSDVLAEYAPESIKGSLLQKLNEMEDWLYDEGEDEQKSVYMDKLAGLRSQGDAIETRYVEAGVRRPAAEKLRGTANAYLNTARSTDARYAHIEAADKKKVVEEAQRALAWLQEKEALQAQVAKHEDPVLLSSDIRKKEDTLRRVAEPILTKPPPAPKKEEPKPEAPKEAEVKGSGEAPNNVPAEGAAEPSAVDIEEVSEPMDT
jgi:heat shock protein 4